MIKLSFTLRVLAVSFIVLALPLLIDSFLFFQSSYFQSIQGAKGRLKEVAEFKKYTLQEIQPVKQILLKEILYFLDLQKKIGGKNSESLEVELAILAHRLKDLQVFILKKTGPFEYSVSASSLPELYKMVFKSYHSLDLILEKGEGSFIRNIYSPLRGGYFPFLFVGRKFLSDSQDPFILMVATEMSIEFQSLMTKPEESQNLEFAILDQDGIVIDATNPAFKGQYFDPITDQRKKEIVQTAMLGDISLAKEVLPIIRGPSRQFFEFVYNDEVQIAYRSPIPELSLSIVAFTSKQQFFGMAVAHFLLIYTIYGLVLLVGGALTYWLAFWVSKPFRRLSEQMGEVSQGNLGARFHPMPHGFEINLLGSMFNNTLDILLENIQQAEDERVKKEIYEKELVIGRKVQKNLLPASTPHIKNAEVGGIYLPVKEAGGDFYGFFVRKTHDGEDALFFGVTDAAGKGIYSCLFAVSFRSLVMSYASLYDDVGVFLSKTNNMFLEDAGDTGMFIKAMNGVYYPSSKTLFYYSCGNIPGIVRKGSGHLFSLEHSGMAIGLQESKGYNPDKVILEEGDFVIFFTDGLIEAENAKHQMYGERRLKNLLQMKNWKSAEEVIQGIIDDVKSFADPMPIEQEITIIVLKVK